MGSEVEDIAAQRLFQKIEHSIYGATATLPRSLGRSVT